MNESQNSQNLIMKYSPLIPLSLITFIVLLSFSLCVILASSHKLLHQNFVQCLSNHSPSILKVVYNPTNSSYSSILNFPTRNLRFSTSKTPTPLLIIKPSTISHIQSSIICSKSHNLQIRIRSGGHDFEGISYVARDDLPFIVVDLIDLRAVTVDVENETAWVQSGATLGELYYKIGEKSRTLGFPTGISPSVGVGGHLSGGGFGLMMRKHGLGADNVIDATLVDANGKYFEDRESMGEDLFWAIRGGGGGSFGVVVAWKLKLVHVPPIVTICSTAIAMEDVAIKLIHQWQYVANTLDHNLFLGIFLIGGNTSITRAEGRINPITIFFSLFLGESNELMKILNTTFPELDLTKKDCIETSWIESTLIAANGFQTGEIIETLLNRSALIPPSISGSSKVKSDYVKQHITKSAIKGMWERLKSEHIEAVDIMFVPYGAKMSEISESSIPFPHRVGNLYNIVYSIGWQQSGVDAEKRHINWIRELYDYMTPFVTNSPRAAYVNYRDLDIGSNHENGTTSYDQVLDFGLKYFGKNFERLVRVKTEVDSGNFFRHEQSIPTLQPVFEFCEISKSFNSLVY